VNLVPGGGTRIERIVGHTHPRPIPYDPIFTQPSGADLYYLNNVAGRWQQVYGPQSQPFALRTDHLGSEPRRDYHLRDRFYARPRCATTLAEEAMMSTVTREQVLERIAGFGPLRNVFLITKDEDTFGIPIIWYPEIGLRYVIIEKDDLAQAVYDYLCEAGVRQFNSEEELAEAQQREKWEGWDSCEDWRRWQQAAAELARKRSS
jgi:hypothetical protein